MGIIGLSFFTASPISFTTLGDLLEFSEERNKTIVDFFI
jgi:hypothetical protein